MKKLQVCKNSSDRMVIALSTERLMEIFLSECKGIGLKFAANVHIGFRVIFSLKKRCFFAVVLGSRTQASLDLLPKLMNNYMQP